MKRIAGYYDLIVAGAGPAGFAAATAAARLGKSVLLIERHGGPGGVAVNCNCPNLIGFSEGGRQIVGGIGAELVRRLEQRGAARAVDLETGLPMPSGGDRLFGTGSVSVDLHELRLEQNRMLLESGVTPYYYATVTGVKTRDETVEGIELFDCSGKREIAGGMLIDASGSGQVSRLAGAACMLPEGEEAMTKTILFRLANVKSYRKDVLRRKFAVVARSFPFPGQDRFMGNALLGRGEVGVNMTLTGGNPLDPAELTAMDIELREQVSAVTAWLRQHFEEFRDCHIVDVATDIGIRCHCTVRGLEVIDCRALDSELPVAEPVALGFYGYGGHGLGSFHSPDFSPHPGAAPIPMKALLSASRRNLLLAGLVISIQPRAVSAIRMMGTCFATGQAAGVIAACGGRDAVYAEVRAALLKQSAILADPAADRSPTECCAISSQL